MAGNERTVRLSVLDRLLDYEPYNAGDPPLTWSESVRQHKAALLRDVEWLLNTRRICEPASDAYPEVQRSTYHFGVPDMSSVSSDSEAAQLRLMRQIEESIRIFEPRLSGVRVSPLEGGAASREVRFTVEAILRMEPNPERVVFDTVLETASGEFKVSGVGDA